MDFSRDELDVLSNAIDIMIRTEGNALAQSGIVGIRGKTEALSARLSIAIGIDAKIQTERKAIVDAQAVVAAAGGGGG